MAVNSTFYLNAADLTLATSVYLDLALTLIAPDGYYKEGSLFRQQSSGILLEEQTICSPCPLPCGNTIGGSGSTGLYIINLDTGTTEFDVGAVIIQFNPASVPDGIRVTYDGVVYNKLCSPNNGVRQSSNPGNFTIVGSSGSISTCGNWYPMGNTLSFQEFLYTSGSFVATGDYTTITIDPGDIQLNSSGLGNIYMVIPKPTSSPNIVTIEILGPCSSTGWTFTAFCPSQLPSFEGSNSSVSADIPCTASLSETYYFYKIHTNPDEYIGLYDYVFLDTYGEFPLADGYYLTNNVAVPNKVIQVANGVVIALTDCI